MNLSNKLSLKLQRRHLILSSLVCLAAISVATVQVEAQSSLNAPSAEATFTPVALGSQTGETLVFAALTPASTRPQMSSALPRFDMNEAAYRYVALVEEADRMASLRTLSTEAIAQALAVTSQTSSKGISEGAGAYATQVAASNPEFAAGLQTLVNLLGRDVVLERLKNDPDSFLSMISGARQAARAASGALATSEAKLARAHEVLGEAAYSVQTESWSQRAVDTPATLAAHRHAASIPLSEGTSAAPLPVSEASDLPINGRYLLAASYRILGDDVAATQVLDKPLGRMCMNRVQLNVRQCLAASQYPYEHLFCLSKHSFGETLACVKDTVK